jgi:hypothetical protein
MRFTAIAALVLVLLSAMPAFAVQRTVLIEDFTNHG